MRRPWWLSGKESICQCSIPGSRRSSGEGNGYPLQYSCLGNLMDRGGWWAIIHGITKSLTLTLSLEQIRTLLTKISSRMEKKYLYYQTND